jgi:hypothetical protein
VALTISRYGGEKTANRKKENPAEANPIFKMGFLLPIENMLFVVPPAPLFLALRITRLVDAPTN